MQAQALIALSRAAESGTVPAVTHKLVHLRASQINGCGVCMDMHSRELRQMGEPDERIFAVAAWRETTYYTDGERAALELAEAATRLADRADPVADDVWDAAAEHYNEKELAGLLVSIAAINAWNRLNAATRQVAGPVGPESGADATRGAGRR